MTQTYLPSSSNHICTCSGGYVVSDMGQILEHKDYRPFGGVLNTTGTGARTGYIDREEDGETGLGSYGVRLYEPEYGRFTSVDALWGLYHGLTTFHYAMNSPLGFSDHGGSVVTAVSESEKRFVQGSVAECQANVVQFDENNQVMAAPILAYLESAESQGAPTENLQALLTGAQSETNVIIHDAVSFNYLDASGQQQNATLKTKDSDGKTLSGTPERDAVGMTIVPNPGASFTAAMPEAAKMFSTDDAVHVYVSKRNNANQSGAQTAGHEIRGHVVPFLQAMNAGSGTWWHGSGNVNTESDAGKDQAREECGP